jgi:hypothetical protein
VTVLQGKLKWVPINWSTADDEHLITNDVKVCIPRPSQIISFWPSLLWKHVDYIPSSAIRITLLSHLEVKVLCLFKFSGAVSTPVCSRLASFNIFPLFCDWKQPHQPHITPSFNFCKWYIYIFIYIYFCLFVCLFVCLCACVRTRVRTRVHFWTDAVQFVVHLKCPNVASLHSPLFALPHNNKTSVFHAVL